MLFKLFSIPPSESCCLYACYCK